MRTYNEIRQMFDDYFWIIKEIARLRDELGKDGWIRTKTTTYSHEPHSQTNRTADPVFSDVLNRDRRFKRFEKMEKKVSRFQNLLDAIDLDDREDLIVYSLLDGMTIVGTSKLIGRSERQARRILDDVIEKMLAVAEGMDEIEKVIN